jgi:prefoldin subunit 5
MSLFDAFKKKEEGEVPDVTEMIRNGMSEQDIIDNLRQQGYDSTSIKDALVNATVAAGNPQNNPPQQTRPTQISAPQFNFSQQQDPSSATQSSPMPQTQVTPASNSRVDNQKSGLSDQALDNIQQILEQIIEEKWEASSSDLNVIRNSFKNTSNSIEMMEDKVTKLSQRIDNIQNMMLGKTEEYNKTLSDVNVELQAFEKVIDRLIPTISDSIKELRDLIDDLKKTKT